MTEAFKTVAFSDPKFECDHLRFITAKSVHLKGRGDVCVFVPPDIDPTKSYPAVILLHGVYGSAWTLAYKAGIHLQVLKMIQGGKLPPMILAMPSDGLWGDGSGYIPHHNQDFEQWIAKDIPNLLKQYIDGVTTESSLFISGLSMGGFGALRIGVKYVRKFTAVAGHSSMTNIRQMKLFVEESQQNYNQADEAEEDIFELIIRHQNNLPAIYFDCGKADLLIDYNRTLHRKLAKAHIDHLYKEHSGDHEWSYWKKHMKDAFLFFADKLI